MNECASRGLGQGLGLDLGACIVGMWGGGEGRELGAVGIGFDEWMDGRKGEERG